MSETIVSEKSSGRAATSPPAPPSGTPAKPQGAPSKVSKVSEAVIRIAGNSQDGIQAIGGFFEPARGGRGGGDLTSLPLSSLPSGGASLFLAPVGSGGGVHRCGRHGGARGGY